MGDVKYLSVKDAGRELKVSKWRVYALIRAGRIKTEKLGSAFLIRPRALDAVRVRKPGRPWPKRRKAQ